MPDPEQDPNRQEGPADGGAAGTPGVHDGGADGAAEGPADGGAAGTHRSGHTVTRLRDGRVLVVAEGPRREVQALLDSLRSGQTPGRVSLVVERLDLPRGDLTGFAER